MIDIGITYWVGLDVHLIVCAGPPEAGLIVGAAGGLRPWGCRVAGVRAVGGPFRVAWGLAFLRSAVLEGGGCLETGSDLGAAVGLGASGLVVLLVAAATGFLAGGLVTSEMEKARGVAPVEQLAFWYLVHLQRNNIAS